MRKTAFTLIELLVTIVLFSLLLATSLYSFRFVSINIKNINNTNPKKAINYTLLRGAIGATYLYVQKETSIDNSFYYYFKGDSIKFRFTTTSPLFYRGIALGEVSFVDKKLIYREGNIFDKEVDYSNLNTISLEKKIIIVDNILNVKFLYYVDGNEELAIEKKIPNLIKIKFIKHGEDREYIFNIKSNGKGQLNMVQTQYKDF